eukprot:GHVN01077131.1.p1 GENE.GHVN01077131.1~~GHVN01077131.1.p1  ORF type:complete len:131 (+),score=7.76 GHVN01077131.1:72-464(+)
MTSPSPPLPGTVRPSRLFGMRGRFFGLRRTGMALHHSPSVHHSPSHSTSIIHAALRVYTPLHVPSSASTSSFDDSMMSSHGQLWGEPSHSCTSPCIYHSCIYHSCTSQITTRWASKGRPPTATSHGSRTG